ncbi:MMPL family transporter [Actinorugispora endophytica]|uniref:MMPL family protein n=1 Tax=Actinorugispora endophytica TaxID=1605990 RepID=A0A4R6V2Q8_9ACTN|nr:MMPL family protein [Actinorugispora endophytica]
MSETETRPPAGGAEGTGEAESTGTVLRRHRLWGRVASGVGARPRAYWLVTAALLLVLTTVVSSGAALGAGALVFDPLLFLFQLAFLVAFGVLLDALIVRSLLVPALSLDVGRAMWWPSHLSRAGKP